MIAATGYRVSSFKIELVSDDLTIFEPENKITKYQNESTLPEIYHTGFRCVVNFM